MAWLHLRWIDGSTTSGVLFAQTGSPLKELGTFRSENEYFGHLAKTIVIAWRILRVYIDATGSRLVERCVTLSFTYQQMKKSPGVKSGPIKEATFCIPLFVQSLGEGDIHRDNLALRPTSAPSYWRMKMAMSSCNYCINQRANISKIWLMQ
ncbi:hypothetical protein TNCV_3776591 [Trichonephila clavipes]|nr:hypothetical protein TNCV_3776591 [Trichonephila clavipes]